MLNKDQQKKESVPRLNSGGGIAVSARSGFRRKLISAFILFHLIGITLWAIPYDLPSIVQGREMIAPYMRWTGLFQRWDMFAPKPILKNRYLKAIVITTHHHIYIWSYPRMDQLSFGERYRKERYRKLAENLTEDQNPLLLADVVNHIARFYNDPNDPPEKVILLKYETQMTPWSDDGNQLEPKPEVLYEDYIEPADLQ